MTPSCEHKRVTQRIGRETSCDDCQELLFREGPLAQELANLRELYRVTKDELDSLRAKG